MRSLALLLGVAVLALVSSAFAQTQEELIQRLKDPEAQIRRQAAEALGKQRAEAAIAALVEVLKDKKESVRDAAGNALATIGQKAVPALASALKDHDQVGRLSAAKALFQLGSESSEALPALTAALKDKNIEIRIHAAATLGRLGPDAKSALPALFEAARDTSNVGVQVRRLLPASVTEAAVRASFQIDPDCGAALAKAALPELTAALKGMDEGALLSAALALAWLGPHAKPALPALQEAYNDAYGITEFALRRAMNLIGVDITKELAELTKDPRAPIERRLKALEKLSSIKEPGGHVISLLTKALKDPEPAIRAGAAAAVARVGPSAKAAIPALLDLLGDADLVEAAEKHHIAEPNPAVHALARMGADALPGLAKTLKDREKPRLVRVYATMSLGLMGRKAKTELALLEACMRDASRLVALESACSYVRAGGDPAKAMPLLQEGLKDESPVVARHTAQIVYRIGPSAKGAVPDLIPLLKHSDPVVRIQAVQALSVLGTAAKEAVPPMAKLLRTGDSSERHELCLTLERLGPDAKEALPVLMELLQERNPGSAGWYCSCHR